MTAGWFKCFFFLGFSSALWKKRSVFHCIFWSLSLDKWGYSWNAGVMVTARNTWNKGIWIQTQQAEQVLFK